MTKFKSFINGRVSLRELSKTVVSSLPRLSDNKLFECRRKMQQLILRQIWKLWSSGKDRKEEIIQNRGKRKREKEKRCSEDRKGGE